MNDTSILVAIDAANSSRSVCYCGKSLDLAAQDGALWLACPAFTAPTRLPAALSSFLRAFAHDRTFVVELPESPAVEPAPVKAGAPTTRRQVPAAA
jgi:hypothetical protein